MCFLSPERHFLATSLIIIQGILQDLLLSEKKNDNKIFSRV